MDFTVSLFERHFQKFLVILSIAALIGLFRFCRGNNTKRDVATGAEDIIMELTQAETIEDVQRYIEQLPSDFTEEEAEKVSLKDLVGDLMKWSEDENWRNLVTSVVCEENNGICEKGKTEYVACA